MKRIKNLKAAISGLVLSVALVASSVAGVSVLAQPGNGNGQDKKLDRLTPPSLSFSQGAQAKAEVEPGTVDAKEMEPLGDTQKVDISADGQLKAQSDVMPLAGNVSGVDFNAPLNYCYRDLVYLPVKNTTSVTKYVKVRVYANSTYHEKYLSVSANSTAYAAFYGITGSYYGYLYVWNGSTYQYDEYKTSENTCRVAVSRVYNTGGWVQLKIENTGTAYATQKSSELAPFPGSGTYTGTHYDYPAAGGAAIYRWFYVGTSPYGIVSDTYGATSNPYLFTGDL